MTKCNHDWVPILVNQMIVNHKNNQMIVNHKASHEKWLQIWLWRSLISKKLKSNSIVKNVSLLSCTLTEPVTRAAEKWFAFFLVTHVSVSLPFIKFYFLLLVGAVAEINMSRFSWFKFVFYTSQRNGVMYFVCLSIFDACIIDFLDLDFYFYLVISFDNSLSVIFSHKKCFI